MTAEGGRLADSERTRAVSARPYRETTFAALALGIFVGIVLTAAMTYAGLVIGFVYPASAIAAILGWGLLRGVLRRGSIVENNINQTVASGINVAAGGVIFTLPALFLMGDVEFDPWAIAVAAVAGALLGTLFIIPLRKQMVELERLRFPLGIAVAEILKSSAAGTRKAVLLGLAMVVGLGFGMLTSFRVVDPIVDPGAALGLPPHVPFKIALSLLSLGAGYLSGRPGLVVLAGGILAAWIVAPLVVALGWVPVPAGIEDATAYLGTAVYDDVTRPLGIGILMGGAIAGVVLALPMLRVVFVSARGARRGDGEEMRVAWTWVGAAGAFVVLAAAAWLSSPDVGLLRALATALIGTLWIWLAGIIVAQCSGLTGWSPISGMALLAVTLILVVVGGGVGLAVLVGAAVCVAIGQGSDMMTDLKTGHLVGSRPIRQQVAQIAVSWIGPIVAILTVYVIWEAMGFGRERNPTIPAAQAETLKGMILAMQGGTVPIDKYLVGGLVGGVLTLGLGGGIGVLVGLSMYLPMYYVLPFGIGCLFVMATDRWIGRGFSNDTGVPIAAGLLVGDSLAGVFLSFYRLFESVGAGS